jgi:dihydrofolate reductase
MFCSILACGQNGEIGLDGELPWEGQYPEDRAFYEDKTELALRIGTRGAIAHFSPNRPCCLISTNVQKPRHCSYVYNWKKFTVEQIFADIDERIALQKKIIVGGVKWYHATASFVDRIYLTRIGKSFNSDRRVDLSIILADRKKISSRSARHNSELIFETWE